MGATTVDVCTLQALVICDYEIWNIEWNLWNKFDKVVLKLLAVLESQILILLCENLVSHFVNICIGKLVIVCREVCIEESSLYVSSTLAPIFHLQRNIC